MNRDEYRSAGGGGGSAIERRLGRIEDTLKHLTRKVDHIMAVTDRIEAAVEKETTVQQGAIVLLNGLSQLIRDGAGDPAKLNALADTMDKNAADLAAAVAANTPATPTPPVEPPVEPTPEEAARRRS